MKKRRIIALLLCLSIAFALLPIGAAAAPGVIYGDADGNRVVDLRDVLIIEEHIGGTAQRSLRQANADVNLDGRIDATDADAIRDYLVGNRVSLDPVQCTVIFNNNGGEGQQSMSAVVSFPLGDRLPIPTKEDEYFLGWKLGDEDFLATDVVKGNMTLDAVYGPIPVESQLHVNSYTINDIEPTHAFDIVGSGTPEQVKNNLTLTPKDGSDPLPLEVTAMRGGNVYSVRAADGFSPGCAYELSLGDGLYFADQENEIRSVNFNVYKDEIDALKYNPDLIFIEDTDDMDYTVDGETTPTLEAAIALENEQEVPEGTTPQPAPDEVGTFTMPGSGLNADDVVCIYVGTHPENRDYTTNDYDDEPLAFIRITGNAPGGYSFKGVGNDELDELLLVPDTILYKVDNLEQLPDPLLTSAHDAASRALLGLTDEPKFKEGDFIVFYTGEFSALLEESPIVYAKISAVSGDEVSYEIIDKDDISAYSDLFMRQNMDANEIAAGIDQQELISQVETQAYASGFADEAAVSMANSSLENGEVQERLREDGYTEEEISQVEEQIRLMGVGGTGTGKSRTAVTVEQPKVDVKIIAGSERWDGRGLGVELTVRSVLSISRKMDNKVVNYVKIELCAGFTQLVDFDAYLDVHLKIKWKWIVIPVSMDLRVKASVTLRNYTYVHASVRLYTVTEQNAKKWEAYSEANASPQWQAQLDELNELAVAAKKAKKKFDEVYEQYEEKRDEILDKAPPIVVDGQEYSLRQLYDEFKMEDATSTFEDVLTARNKNDNKVAMDKLMTKYQEMLESECDFVPLLTKNIFSSEVKCGVVAVNMSIDLVIKAKANVTVGASLEYEVGKCYSFWINIVKGDSGSGVRDVLDEHFGFEFHIMGNLAIRAGLKASLDFGVISTKVGSVGMNVEFGPYLELWGYFFYLYNRIREANTSTWIETKEMQGALYIEFGIYLTIKFKAQLFGSALKYEPTLYDDKFPLLTAGVRRSVYDFANHPKQGEVLRITDWNIDPRDGIMRPLTETGYLHMMYIDLCTGDLGIAPYDPKKFSYQVSDRRFTVNNMGEITVTPNENDRYIAADLRVVWTCDKLAFSKYDIDITIPIVWTTLTDEQLEEQYYVTVSAGDMEGGYRTIWNDRVSRVDVFDLPTQTEILEKINYDSYNYEPASGGEIVNLRYSGIGDYTAGTQTEGISLIADANYYYDIPQRQYTLTVQGVKLPDGSTETRTYTAAYGESFDLSDLAGTGQDNAGDITRFLNLSRTVNGETIVFEPDTRADALFYEAHRGFSAVCDANYVSDKLTATFEFVGLGAVKPSVDVSFRRGAMPEFDAHGFISGYLAENPDLAPFGSYLSVTVPELGKPESSLTYTVDCDWIRTATAAMNFETNGGSSIAQRQMPIGWPISSDMLPTPSRAGYNFAGWYMDGDLQLAFEDGYIMPEEGATLYAKWSAKVFEVSFVSSYSTHESLHMAYNSQYGSLPDPRHSDFTFVGWFTAPNGNGYRVAAGDYLRSTAPLRLYAYWGRKGTLEKSQVTVTQGQTDYVFDGDTHRFMCTALEGSELATLIAAEGKKIVPESEGDADCFFRVSYTKHGTKYTDNKPISVEAPLNGGTYDVTLERDATNEHKAVKWEFPGAVTILRASINMGTPAAYVNGMSLAVRQPPNIPGEGELSYNYRYRIASSNYAGSTAQNPSIVLPYITLTAGVWQVQAVVAESENYLGAQSGWVNAIGDNSVSHLNYNFYATIHTGNQKNAGTDSSVYSQYYLATEALDGKKNLNLSHNDFEQDYWDTYLIAGNVSPWMIRGMYIDMVKHDSSPNWYMQDLWFYISTTYKDPIKHNTDPPGHYRYGSFNGSYHYANTNGPWLGDGVQFYSFQTDLFKRGITGVGNFNGNAGGNAIDLTATSPVKYQFDYNGLVTDQYRPSGSGLYNAFSYYDPPTLTVKAVGGGYNKYQLTALERYVYFTGVKSFEVDSAALRDFMVKEGMNSGFDYTVTLQFPTRSTTVNTSKYTKTINVYAPVPEIGPPLQPSATFKAADSLAAGLPASDGQTDTVRLMAVADDLVLTAGAPEPVGDGSYNVSVNLSGIPDLWGILASVSYDRAALELVGCAPGGSAFAPEEFTLGQNLAAENWRFLATRELLEDTAERGELLILRFMPVNGADLSLESLTPEIIQAINAGRQVVAGSDDAPPPILDDDYVPVPGQTPPTVPDATEPWVNPFRDVNASDWFYDAVAYCKENGVMKGVSPTEFNPGGTVSRAEVWQVLANLAGIESDTSKSPWYSDALAWAMGIGISDGTNPTGKVHREQLVTMLYRYYTLIAGGEFEGGMSAQEFDDFAKVSDWAELSVQWGVSEGIIEGSDNKLNPIGNASRAELATILMRFDKLLKG